MKRITSTAVLTLALGFALSACAPSWMARPDNGPHGIVSAATMSPPLGMHRVVLQEVDGKAVSSSSSLRIPPHASLMVVKPGFQLTDARSQFNLPPGEHQLEFTAVVDERDAQMFLSTTSPYAEKSSGKLKIKVQEGKRYYIAGKVNEGKPTEWEPVVYKIEDISDYGKTKG